MYSRCRRTLLQITLPQGARLGTLNRKEEFNFFRTLLQNDWPVRAEGELHASADCRIRRNWHRQDKTKARATDTAVEWSMEERICSKEQIYIFTELLHQVRLVHVSPVHKCKLLGIVVSELLQAGCHPLTVSKHWRMTVFLTVDSMLTAHWQDRSRTLWWLLAEHSGVCQQRFTMLKPSVTQSHTKVCWSEQSSHIL